MFLQSALIKASAFVTLLATAAATAIHPVPGNCTVPPAPDDGQCLGIKTYAKGRIDLPSDSSLSYIVANVCTEDIAVPALGGPTKRVYLYIFISVHTPLGNDRNDRNVYLNQDRAPAGHFDFSLDGVGTHLLLDFDTAIICNGDKITIKFYVHATGSLLLGRLDERREFEQSNDALTSLLKALQYCRTV